MKTIAICSSMQFRTEIVAVKQQLEELGWQVFTPELSEKSEDYNQLSPEEQRAAKRTFITNHFDRINKSDAILVLNYDKRGIAGYIGANTLMEIGVACSMNKDIYILHELGEQGCAEEVLALSTRILDGNLQNIE